VIEKEVVKPIEALEPPTPGTPEEPKRVTYLERGQATVGMWVYVERGRSLIAGLIISIEEPPARQVPRARRCVVKAGRREYREVEDRLLV